MKKKIISFSVFFASSLLFFSCTYVHKVSIGEIDDRSGFEKVPFEVLVSEIGVNVDEAVDLAGFLASTNNKEENEVKNIIKLFQFGPVTGNPVYNETYAENILESIMKKCPDGRTSNLTVIRETNKYPVVSGEIIRITGYCLR